MLNLRSVIEMTILIFVLSVLLHALDLYDNIALGLGAGAGYVLGQAHYKRKIDANQV